MKTNKILYAILAISISFSACEDNEKQTPSSDEHSLTIQNIKGAFDYTFTASNGRSLETPDEINTLVLKIIDQDGELIYDQYYHSWDYDSGTQIPDSIYIPDLAAGEYQVYASTVDSYYYADEYCCDSTGTNYSSMIIDPYTVSHNPIYVGNQTITVVEDVEVELDMRNISAKLTLNIENLNYPETLFGDN